MALQRLYDMESPGDPLPYMKQYLKSLYGQGGLPNTVEKIPVSRTPIQYSNTLMPNRTPQVTSTIKAQKGNRFRKVMDEVQAGANTLMPFATNIINAFRNPPNVPMPNLDSQVTLQKLNMDDARNQVERGIRGANANGYRSLDENTATAVSSYNLAQRFNQLSTINEAEQNANKQISNQEVLTNAGIGASNNSKLDQRDLNIVERKIAMQRENSQNLANAADKKISIDNERRKSDLDLKRFGILMKAYNNEGVAGREFGSLNELMMDPIGAEFVRNNADKTEKEILKKANEEYNTKIASRKKRWKEDTNEFLSTKKKYGGQMKYSTGGMVKRLNLSHKL